MEAVLDIYKRPYDELYPVLCFDESSKQQMQDVIEALPIRPGEVMKYDSEYKRNGVSNLFMIFEPLQGKRHVRITDRLDIQYTPKHGSWLNMVEIEFSALSRQCLKRRIPTQEVLRKEIGAWEVARKQDSVGCDWQFTTDDARIKLKKLYPNLV